MKKALIAIVVIVVGFLSYVALQPADYKVSREIRINASAEAIFPYANNPKKMSEWNPWMKMDPHMKVTYSGSEEGVGAITDWEGNNQVGVGTATIVESSPPTLVRTTLQYKKPFTGISLAEVALRNEGAETIVTWSNMGKAPFFSRIICTLFGGMDKMVGKVFEDGLKNLKLAAEAAAIPPALPPAPETK